MNKVFALVMYVLWTGTITAVLIATFTNFQYEDLNFIAMILLAFASLNSYLVISHKK